jgi:L-fuculose-phosphate aldolase
VPKLVFQNLDRQNNLPGKPLVQKIELVMKLLQQQLVETNRKLTELGLNQGTSGNVSIRAGEGILVTPSARSALEMTAKDMVFLEFNESSEVVEKKSPKPSSEWRFHHDILQNRPEINAVIHCHSMFATTIACLRVDLPAFHYMIAIAGGNSIRCADYALFATRALSNKALLALEGRFACLLANHGMIAIGHDLSHALKIAVAVEELCEQFWRVLQLGEPILLTETQMQNVHQQFKGYGQWHSIEKMEH